jgi:uncharacterized protein YebE (UPF0316 family)
MVESFWYELVFLSALIFAARVVDVSLGTMRIVFVSRQMKGLATLTGFFEVLVWLLAIRQIFQNMDAAHYLLAYAAGYATGNYVGLWIDDRLAMGLAVIRIITRQDTSALGEALKSSETGFTILDAQGPSGPVRVVFIVARKRELDRVITLVRSLNPDVFYTVEDLRTAARGSFPLRQRRLGMLLRQAARMGK